jgi:hypothetical protein
VRAKLGQECNLRDGDGDGEGGGGAGRRRKRSRRVIHSTFSPWMTVR